MISPLSRLRYGPDRCSCRGLETDLEELNLVVALFRNTVIPILLKKAEEQN